MLRRCSAWVTLVALCAVEGCTPPHYGEPLDANPGQAADADVDAGLDDQVDVDAGDDAVNTDAERERDAAQDEAGLDGAASPSDDPQPGLDATHAVGLGDAEAGVDTAVPEPPEPHPDTWAGPLLGTYVARIDSFTRDTLVGVINRIQEVALITIERTGSEVWLTSQTCSWIGENDVGSTRLVRPYAVPPRRERVRYAGGRWRTEPGLQALGYSAASPAACAGMEGLNVTKQPGQGWLAETCNCGSPNASVPTLEDCRIGDPDGDAAPGITYQVETVFNTSVAVHVVREFRFSFRDGVISDAGRHSAHEVQDQQSLQLSCHPKDCLKIANLSVPCPPSTNLVQLAPVLTDGGPATCELALLRAKTDLVHPRPDVPLCPK